MKESRYIHKSHNVSILLYHFVCPAKYRRVVFSEMVDETLKDICLEIEKRYEIHFVCNLILSLRSTSIFRHENVPPILNVIKVKK